MSHVGVTALHTTSAAADISSVQVIQLTAICRVSLVSGVLASHPILIPDCRPRDISQTCHSCPPLLPLNCLCRSLPNDVLASQWLFTDG